MAHESSTKQLNAKLRSSTAASNCGPSSNMVGMVISGRAARACDVCGKERARWYCAADLAYLCERCDRSVHSANAVAGRHERGRLGPNGMPVKVASVNVKQEASAPASSPAPTSAQSNPRKRPRSIRRHKPRSFHASQHVLSFGMNASNHFYSSSHYASNYCNEAGSILASTHGVMIHNPRNDPDFIANSSSNDLSFNKAFVVKSEPYSPVDIGDQMKVPDHMDDDQLLESLFDDFRDLQDDDLFLQQVPIYNPLQSQVDLALTPPHDQYAEEEEVEEEKPIINLAPPALAVTCPNTPSPELHQAEDSQDLPLVPTAQGDETPSPGDCNEADQSTDNDICDLDQLDFDCVLQGEDDDGSDMSHAAMEIDTNSQEYLDIYAGHTSTKDNAFGEVKYNPLGTGTTDDAAGGHFDAKNHANYAEFDFDATGSQSPRTWLCKVKVESPPELEMGQGQHSTVSYNDALLREKLTCKSLSADSQHTFRLGLKLNFEDVLNSWSDSGTFWMDGHGPSQVGNCFDFLGGCFVPDVSGTHATEDPEGLLVSVLNQKNLRSDGGAREASVLRYREKRRTRLFSKKIRYEVRKLNAEKRPRMKGRFVKRIAT